MIPTWARSDNSISLGTKGALRLSRCRVTPNERNTHTYVIGITGKGKSKLLESMLYQDVIANRGCGVLDPHGDLATDLLKQLHMPEGQKHLDRVVYFDPASKNHVVPFNVLDTSYEPHVTARNIVEAFRRAWPEALREAPRFSNVLTFGIVTLCYNGLTLVDLQDLLTDKDYREVLLKQVDDEEVLKFWYDRYDRWGRDAPQMIESILNKITFFTLDPTIRTLLGCNTNALDFRRIMDEGKVLIVNLGHLDHEMRRLVGSLIVTKIEQAAFSRSSSIERRPFYFCVDEFQDFCTNEGSSESLAQILSECRKFGLHLTLAHQTLAQLNERMRGALGNIQLKIVFEVSRADAEILAKHLFSVDTEQVKHIVQQDAHRSHPVYYSLPEQWELKSQLLSNMPARVAYVKRPRTKVLTKIRTETVRYPPLRDGAIDEITQRLLLKMGRSRENVEMEIRRRRDRLTRVELNNDDQEKQFAEALT